MTLISKTFRVVLGRAYRGETGGFPFARNFNVGISVSPHVCFILVLIFDFYVSKIKHLRTSYLPRKPNN